VATRPNICARIFFLKANDYAALWDQVRDGQYETCTITLGLTPVDYTGPEPTWIKNPLSIDSAAVDFTREMAPKKVAASEKVHYTPSKPWAAGLFVAAALTWFFPHWNGLLFGSSDATTGESRIVAAVLFVGGLLLWFLAPSKSATDAQNDQ
jgi:hypothetical protein